MQMIILIGTYECGYEGKCLATGQAECAGHGHIEIRNAAQPFSWRRPAWASLEFVVTPPKGATETLRWAVAQLDANLRAHTLPADEDDYAELLG